MEMLRVTAVIAALLAVVAAAGSATATAAPNRGPRINASPATVVAGNRLVFRISGSGGRRCTFTIRSAAHGAKATYTRRTRASRIALDLPAGSSTGVRLARITCGGRSASVRFRIVAPALAPAPVQAPDLAVPISERLDLSDALPPGEGNPSDYVVRGPANAGGAGFSTYWPLSRGQAARITEAPGGSYSHYTIYTHDAVDLGVGTGTEIRAGFTGVVARVNNGCAVGNYSCGNGYGNYVYLKASDGTCAVMAHLSRVDVSPGQQLPQYGLIGLSGTTGNSTGPHLHYDRVDCGNNRSLPWSPVEGGSLQEGAAIVSQNHPPDASAPPPTAPPTTTPPTTPPPPPTWGETAGGVAHTWTNYTNAGGTEGPSIGAFQTVQISCKVQGFRVADGNTWWYRIASSPWTNVFFVSADAFYNNGQTTGSLHGTPFVDPNVANC
jgi:murein DD-endopeptidase MepM/ murein hydrolase activator NlpD